MALTAGMILSSTAVVGAGAAAGSPGRAPEDSRHENGPIADSAFTVAADGGYGPREIAVVRGRSGYQFLTDVANGALNPDFTPDGQTIFFWSPQPDGPDTVFTVPVHGGTPTEVPTNCASSPNCLGDSNPAISPDGSQLLTERALAPFDEQGCPAFVGLFLFRIDGSHGQRISPTTQGCESDQGGRWSPDGQRIVFRHGDVTGFSIWIMNRDGSGRHPITPAGMDAGSPDWSPDGQKIVFQSPDENPGPDPQNPQQLYTIRPDGTHLEAITHYPANAAVVVRTNGPRWSPDGRKIVFAHLDADTTLGPDGLPHADLFVINATGGGVRQINATPEKDNTPAWGPSPPKDD